MMLMLIQLMIIRCILWIIGRLMNNSSKPGWVVGDFFGGSGTTLMAAEQLGRTAYIMELDPRNVDIIAHRWEAFTGQQAERIRGGEQDG